LATGIIIHNDSCSLSLSLSSWQQDLSFATAITVSPGIIIHNDSCSLSLSLSSWQQDLSFATAITVSPLATG
jgi:hypothetical protein